MKKNFILLVLSIFLFSSVHAQDVPQTQKSFIAKVTATWCFNCGTWGWDLFEGLVEDNEDNALVIANHYSGDLSNPTSDLIAENYNIFGQPRFILNDMDQNASSGNAMTKRSEIKDLVDNMAMSTPLANTGLMATMNNGLLTVNTKTRFFQPTSGAYYVGIYIIEDGVVNNQSGQGMNTVHKNVLRTVMGPDAFGTLIMDGSIAMNMEFDQEFNMMLDPNWNTENLEIAAIIWKKDGDAYQFVNTHSTEINTATSISLINENRMSVNVLPTISAGTAHLTLSTTNLEENVSINIYNELGQLVRKMYQGNIQTGFNQFEIPSDLPSASYFVNIRLNDQSTKTQKFIIQ